MDYTYIVNPDNSFTVFYRNEEIHTSRKFRLSVQAERKAIEWIDKTSGILDNEAITLEVQNLTIDPDTLFGG